MFSPPGTSFAQPIVTRYLSIRYFFRALWSQPSHTIGLPLLLLLLWHCSSTPPQPLAVLAPYSAQASLSQCMTPTNPTFATSEVILLKWTATPPSDVVFLEGWDWQHRASLQKPKVKWSEVGTAVPVMVVPKGKLKEAQEAGWKEWIAQNSTVFPIPKSSASGRMAWQVLRVNHLWGGVYQKGFHKSPSPLHSIRVLESGKIQASILLQPVAGGHPKVATVDLPIEDIPRAITLWATALTPRGKEALPSLVQDPAWERVGWRKGSEIPDRIPRNVAWPFPVVPW